MAEIKVNQITEISDGIYESVLDFPTKDFLKVLISDKYRYVWCVCYEEDMYEWNTIGRNLYGMSLNEVLVRNVRLEYILETSQFIELIPHIKGGHFIQMNKIPSYYLSGSMDHMNIKTKYDLLKKETDFLFEIDLPPSPDYTPVISPDRDFLEEALTKL